MTEDGEIIAEYYFEITRCFYAIRNDKSFAYSPYHEKYSPAIVSVYDLLKDGIDVLHLKLKAEDIQKIYEMYYMDTALFETIMDELLNRK